MLTDFIQYYGQHFLAQLKHDSMRYCEIFRGIFSAESTFLQHLEFEFFSYYSSVHNGRTIREKV